MAALVLSATDTGTGIVVVTTMDGLTPLASFEYPEAPPDGRSQPQWVIDCGNAALGITNDGTLGDAGPDASAADDTAAVVG